MRGSPGWGSRGTWPPLTALSAPQDPAERLELQRFLEAQLSAAFGDRKFLPQPHGAQGEAEGSVAP